jgi:hypothetical protein
LQDKSPGIDAASSWLVRHQYKEETMKTRDEYIDRMLGYLGLFIIGALGWTADRLGDLRAAWPGSHHLAARGGMERAQRS